MSRGKRPFEALFLAALLMAVVPAVASGESQCGTCHPEERVVYEASEHASEEVACEDCHGGDPLARSVERAHGGDFSGLTDRLKIPEMCAGCHADLAKMSPFNLPVDQYAIYQTSQHGRAVASGEPRAAVCTDCHGVHDIRSPADPSSPAHPRNLSDTCARCHADQGLMERYGLDTGLVEEYQNSVHGKTLIEASVAAAPSCASCHGVHGATPPGVGDVDKVCGGCHAETRAAFRAGPHYQAMLDAGIAECASCHGHHAIARFGHEDLETLCQECHEEDSDETKLGAKFATLIASATESVDQAAALVAEAERSAILDEDHLSGIEAARTALQEVSPLVHAVSLEPVEEVTRRARSIGEQVQHELYSRMDRTVARFGLLLFWFYLLMTLAILVLYRRRLGAEATRT